MKLFDNKSQCIKVEACFTTASIYKEAAALQVDKITATSLLPGGELNFLQLPNIGETCLTAWWAVGVVQALERAAATLRQEVEDDEARIAALAQAHARERERERQRTAERIERERREFGGCYSAVLEAILQPLPKQVSFATACSIV